MRCYRYCNNNYRYGSSFYRGGYACGRNTKGNQMYPAAKSNICHIIDNENNICGKEHSLPYSRMAASSFGGIILPELSAGGKEYDLTVLTLKCPEHVEGGVELSFACNLILANTQTDICIQIYRLWSHETNMLSVCSPFVYARPDIVSLADSISFKICDRNCIGTGNCIYIVKMYVTKDVSKNGSLMVVNPILSVII